MVTSIPAQMASQQTGSTAVWQKVAIDGDSISIPAGTVTQYGAKAGTLYGCGTGVALAADMWVTPMTLGASVTPADLGVPDPAYCYVKELDVLETASPQIIQVNGKPMTVPALPVVVVSPPVAMPVKTWSCTGTITYSLFSDGTFSTTGTGLVCKETL